MSVEIATALSEKGIMDISAALGEPEWLRAKRLAAFEAYENMALPNWDRTSLTSLDLDAVAIAPAGVEMDAALPERLTSVVEQAEGQSNLIVQVNGVTTVERLSPELAEQGVIVCDLATAIRDHEALFKEHYQSVIGMDEDKFVALHYAAVASGLFVYVPKNVAVALPIEYRVAVTVPGIGLHPHVLVVAEEGAEVTVLEGVTSDDGDQQRVVSEVVELVPGDGAHIRFGSVQTWGDHTYQFTLRRSVVKRDGRVDWIAGDFGGRLSRTHAKSVLAGEGSESTSLGVFFCDKNQHLDVGITMMHEGSHTASDMLTKGVLDDRSRVVYRGLTDIEHGARYTSGFQNENTMLLSKNARSDAIPGLEIDETEVQAGHAATTGQIDPVHLFYLRSRGLTEEEAVHLIVTGFFDPVIARMEHEGIQDELRELIDGKMGG